MECWLRLGPTGTDMSMRAVIAKATWTATRRRQIMPMPVQLAVRRPMRVARMRHPPPVTLAVVNAPTVHAAATHTPSAHTLIQLADLLSLRLVCWSWRLRVTTGHARFALTLPKRRSLRHRLHLLSVTCSPVRCLSLVAKRHAWLFPSAKPAGHLAAFRRSALLLL